MRLVRAARRLVQRLWGVHVSTELRVRSHNDVVTLGHPVDALAGDRARDDAGRRAGDAGDATAQRKENARGRHCGRPPSDCVAGAA